MGGLFKKVVVSSYVSTAIVQPVFAAPHQHSGLEVIFAAWGYAVQIYCDFSGYTDIAIGLALLLGFPLPGQLRRPLHRPQPPGLLAPLAHHALALAARLPLHPARGATAAARWSTARNIMITMVLGGLWHGANWTFIVWGGLHGAGQVVGHFRRAAPHRPRPPGPCPRGPSGCGGSASGRSSSSASVGSSSTPARSPTRRRCSAASSSAGARRRSSRRCSCSPSRDSSASQFVPGDGSAGSQALFSRRRAAVQVARSASLLLVITTLGPDRRRPVHLLPVLMRAPTTATGGRVRWPRSVRGTSRPADERHAT